MAPPVSGAQHVNVHGGKVLLDGDFTLPPGARALVVLADGSGSSRCSPRNRFVARVLQHRGFGTLLSDLLTREEDSADERAGRLRFDIPLLAERLVDTIDWLGTQDQSRMLTIGLFGTSTEVAAALVAAADRPDAIRAVVASGGRPDLAGPALARVQAPTLLVVGGDDEPVMTLNRRAMARMRSETRLAIVPGATHLFEEAGTLEQVARHAAEWFETHL